MMAERKVQTPGAPADAGGALNNTDANPNTIAAEREAATAAAAAADLLQKGDVKGAMAVMANLETVATAEPLVTEEVASVDLSSFGPGVELVTTPVIRRSREVEVYGEELPWPNATRLNAAKQPVAGNEAAAYVVGNLHVKGLGVLVNRAIPLQDSAA